MSIEVLNLAFYVDGLTPTQKAVLISLANYANPDGGHAFPSVRRMSLMTAYTERTVRRTLSDLRESGLISIVKESKRHSSTVYQINLAQLQSLQVRPVTGSGLKNLDLSETTLDLSQDQVSTNTRDLLTKVEPKKEDAIDFSSLPDSFSGNKEFTDSWKDWEIHRKQIKHKLTPLTRTKQFKRLSSLPVKIAIHMLENSMENGWQGLFKPKGDDPIWQEVEQESISDDDPWKLYKEGVEW